MSDSPGLVDFAIRLMMFVLNLPDGQVLFFGEIQITEGLLSILLIKNGWPLAHFFRFLLGDCSLRHRTSYVEYARNSAQYRVQIPQSHKDISRCLIG